MSTTSGELSLTIRKAVSASGAISVSSNARSRERSACMLSATATWSSTMRTRIFGWLVVTSDYPRRWAAASPTLIPRSALLTPCVVLYVPLGVVHARMAVPRGRGGRGSGRGQDHPVMSAPQGSP